MARLTVVLLTYQRTEYAVRTITALGEHLVDPYSGVISDPIRLHIADDGSTQEHKDEILHAALSYWPKELISLSDSGHRGYGANYNAATQVVHQFSDYIMPVEDDWELSRKLDCDQLISAMDKEPELLGCVRLGNIGYTGTLQGKFIWVNDQHYIALDASSSEKHVFAGHPRIESVQWSRKLGPWPEGLTPGETELSVCGRRNSRLGVAWPVDLIHPIGDLFLHIGEVRSTDV